MLADKYRILAVEGAWWWWSWSWWRVTLQMRQLTLQIELHLPWISTMKQSHKRISWSMGRKRRESGISIFLFWFCAIFKIIRGYGPWIHWCRRAGITSVSNVAADIYYAACSAFDWHNLRRCDDLKLEKKLGTHNWGWCVNLSIFCVSIVDTYNVSTQLLAYEETSCVLFCALYE